MILPSPTTDEAAPNELPRCFRRDEWDGDAQSGGQNSVLKAQEAGRRPERCAATKQAGGLITMLTAGDNPRINS